MYKETEYVERLKSRGLSDKEAEVSLRSVEELGSYLASLGQSLERPGIEAVEAWIARRLGDGVEGLLLSIARYFAATKEEAVAIRLLAYLSPIGVLPAMAERLAALESAAVRERVMAKTRIPPAGSPPESYPEATAAFAAALRQELGEEKARFVLAWNVHGVPPEAFAPERERFLALGSIDAWLADYHHRQVAMLEKHAADGSLWFEQKITKAVVDFVADRQDIMSGVREGEIIRMTKIPYNPDAYLRSTDRLERRKLACHCPLAASSIVEGGAGVPALWCACSAGYTKFRFDVVFGLETEAWVLDSVLAGDELCAFAVRIPASLPHT